MRWIAFSLVVLLVLGCPSAPDEDASSDEVTSEGVNIQEDPLGALSALAGIGDELQTLQQELEEMPDVEAVHFNDLMPSLPDPLDGYTADDAKGSTNQMGDTKISSVSRTYRADEGEGEVHIEISDWAFHKALYLPFVMQSKFSQETTEGWNKGIKVGEDPGREQYQSNSQTGERMVLLRKRFPVKIAIRNLPPEAFDEWWAAVKKDELP